MQITAIKAQVKNPNRVSIFVDGVYGFSLTLSELLHAKLKITQELTPAELKRLKAVSADGKLRARALEWCMSRPRSTKELKEYLRRKEAGDELIDRIVAEFQKNRYQDDAHFALWWVEQRRLHKQRSARYITSELSTKGVSRELIAAALGASSSQDRDTLTALIEKKRRNARYQADEEKLIAYLLRQGYSYSLVKEVLAE